MIRRALAAGLLALLLAACGGNADGDGKGVGEEARSSEDRAQLWITRDRGAEVLLAAEVDAGLTVMQALRSHADVETRHGGRFVQAISGLEGSLSDLRDWFFFVNGIEPDLGAAEVTLRAGDVAWWDYRFWGEQMRQPVVVGAFPEPFLHGWEGKRRPLDMRAPPELAQEAAAITELLGADGVGEPNIFVLEIVDDADGALLSGTRGEATDSPVTFSLSGRLDAVRAAARALVDNPSIVRFRYEARFDADGKVVE